MDPMVGNVVDGEQDVMNNGPYSCSISETAQFIARYLNVTIFRRDHMYGVHSAIHCAIPLHETHL